MSVTEFQAEVVPSRYYDCTDIDGGEGWSWPELRVTARVDGHSARLRVPMYDTREGTVTLAEQKAREHLEAKAVLDSGRGKGG